MLTELDNLKENKRPAVVRTGCKMLLARLGATNSSKEEQPPSNGPTKE
ncbi:MAG TPA: hypothetical protein VGJ00_03955 [Rhabdochlamydiaceae bacterium]